MRNYLLPDGDECSTRFRIQRQEIQRQARTIEPDVPRQHQWHRFEVVI